MAEHETGNADAAEPTDGPSTPAPTPPAGFPGHPIPSAPRGFAGSTPPPNVPAVPGFPGRPAVPGTPGASTPPPGFPGGPPLTPGTGAAPPRPPAKRQKGGCGVMAFALVVVVAIVGGIAFAVTSMNADDPPSDDAMEEALPDLCESGEEVENVEAYRRGASNTLAAVWEQGGDGTDSWVIRLDEPEDRSGRASFGKATVALCLAPVSEVTMPCDYLDNRGGQVTIEWANEVTTELRLVDVSTGKEVHQETFDTTGDGCPKGLVTLDGSATSTRPENEISQQAKALAVAFHTGS